MSPTRSAVDPAGELRPPDEAVVGQDVLRLEGMRFFGHHGCLADERSAGVHLDVDVEVRTDTREAARTDRVEDTIDYARLVEKCRRVVEDDSYHLVETVAERLAEGLPGSVACGVGLTRPILDGLGAPADLDRVHRGGQAERGSSTGFSRVSWWSTGLIITTWKRSSKSHWNSCMSCWRSLGPGLRVPASRAGM